MGFFEPNVEKLKKKKNVKGLIKALQYQKDEYGDISEIGIDAAKALGEIGDATAVELLIKILLENELESDLLRWCTEALGPIGDKRAVEPLIKILENKREEDLLLRSTVEALGRIGDKRVIEPLVKSLEYVQKEPSDKHVVAEVLKSIGDKRAIEPLIKALKTGIVKELWIYEVLREFGDQAVDLLIKVLEDGLGNKDFLEKVARTLSRFDSERARCNNTRRRIMSEIETRLRREKVESIKSLLQCFHEGHTIDAINACDELLEFGSLAYQPLIDGLANSNANMREECAWVLGRLYQEGLLADSRSVPHLTELVRDTYYGVRRNVAWALGKIGKSECVPPLLILVEDNIGSKDEKRIVRGEAADALEEIERTLPPFNQKYGGYKAT